MRLFLFVFAAYMGYNWTLEKLQLKELFAISKGIKQQEN